MNASASRPARLRVSMLRLVCAVGAASILFSGLAIVAPTPAATAVEGDGSSVTVAWAGGNAPDLQQYQVTRSADPSGQLVRSGHYADFKDLTVSVSKTRDLGDEAIVVDIAGMAPSIAAIGGETSNYVHVMQCWGADPSADDFRETCQFGSYSGQAGDGKAADQVKEAGPLVTDRGRQISVAENGVTRYGAPFRSPQGRANQPVPDLRAPTGFIPGHNGLAEFFTAATSNEKPIVRISDARTARIVFEVQSATAQPYLGCGVASAERCWLVVVPRGSHSGTLEGATTQCGAGFLTDIAFGDNSFFQVGSPLDDNCSYWDQRVVVPLDFRTVGATCPPGTPERRVLGSELASSVMSSWQGELCQAEGGTTFALVTNPARTVRDQLVSGLAGVALTLRPVQPETVSAESADALAGTRMRYAPVANTGIGIAFVSERNAVKISSIRISARVLAKLLTMSYGSQAPAAASNAPAPSHVAHNPTDMWRDPELARINPDIPESRLWANSGAMSSQIMLVGPQGDDVVGAVWAYLRADDAARAFLSGQPDENGMSINPYFLPADNPAALGGGLPFDLATDPVDSFPKADQTLAPDKATAERDFQGQQVDAVLMSPYSTSFEAVSQRILRGNTGYPVYDTLKLNSAQEYGAWTSLPSVPNRDGGKQLFGVTDLPSAMRYGLDFVSLQRPNSTEFVAPTDEALARSTFPEVSDDLASITVPSAADTPEGGYPLATTIFAATDTASVAVDDAARAQYATLLEYAGAAGQQPGEQRGQLPRGYIPLTESQRAQTAAFAELMRNPVGPDPVAEQGGSPLPPAGSTASSTSATATAAGASGTTATSLSATAAADRADTGAGASSVGVGGALIAGVAGLVLSPFLLRRRGVGG